MMHLAVKEMGSTRYISLSGEKSVNVIYAEGHTEVGVCSGVLMKRYIVGLTEVGVCSGVLMKRYIVGLTKVRLMGGSADGSYKSVLLRERYLLVLHM